MVFFQLGLWTNSSINSCMCILFPRFAWQVAELINANIWRTVWTALPFQCSVHQEDIGMSHWCFHWIRKRKQKARSLSTSFNAPRPRVCMCLSLKNSFVAVHVGIMYIRWVCVCIIISLYVLIWLYAFMHDVRERARVWVCMRVSASERARACVCALCLYIFSCEGMVKLLNMAWVILTTQMIHLRTSAKMFLLVL